MKVPDASEKAPSFRSVVGVVSRKSCSASRSPRSCSSESTGTNADEMNVSGMVIPMEVRMRRPNLGVVTMTTPMGDIRSGVNGDVVWAVGPMGAQRLEGAQAEDIRIRTAFDADILFDIYPTMETVERAEFGGKACWKVRMETASGTVLHRCFDVDTGLMVAAIQNQQGMEVTAIFDQYKEFDGLKYPAHSTASAMGQTVETTLVNVSHADIAASEFAVPSEVQ